MFKRLARKRKRREEEDALGLTEEMKEALGMGRIESDSDESSSEDSNSEQEGEEQGGKGGFESEDEEEEYSEAEEDEDDEVEKQPEIAPTGISKRAMKKRARKLSIQSIRERHAKRKLKALEKKKADGKGESNLGSQSKSKATEPLPATHVSPLEAFTTKPKVQKKKKDVNATEREGKVKQTNSKGPQSKESNKIMKKNKDVKEMIETMEETEGKINRRQMADTKASIPPSPSPSPVQAKPKRPMGAGAHSVKPSKQEGTAGKDTLQPAKKKRRKI